MILNELVSNALKHAFPDRQQGAIHVHLHSDRERCQLLVSDNGVGLPKGFVLQQADTLGLSLVTTLVSQLQGAVEVEEGVGTSVKISFPVMRDR